MDIPRLVRERLGDEEVVATVSLGDEDLVCVAPSRTLVYRGEGLLSDESVTSYAHDVERFDVSEGRRKTKFVFEYVDGTESFTVPSGQGETLLSLLLQGILRVAGVAEDRESVAGVFRFSELTLVVTESRLVKHVGEPVWDDDYEVFDYDDVTGLDFEEGSVATQVVLSVEGRPQRIKAPTDEAPQVRQTLTQTLCAHYGVDSLSALDDRLAERAEELDAGEDAADGTDPTDGLSLDDGISPLVGDPGDSDTGSPEGTAAGGSTAGAAGTEAEDRTRGNGGSGSRPATDDGRPEALAEDPDGATGGASRGGPGPADAGPADTGTSTDAASGTDPTGAADSSDDRGAADSGAGRRGPADDPGAERPPASVDPEEIEAIKEQLSTLTTAVRRQNELLRRHDERLGEHTETIATHDETIEQLIDELRRGR